MKSFLASLGLALSLFTSPLANAEITTVPYVDVSKYLGDWYQISHVPLWFEGPQDCGCARQRLGTTSKAGVVSVLNTCTRDNGSLYSISGTATSNDSVSNSKFTVSFQGIPFDGTYWIIGLDSEYRYAVVTDRGGDALYIISKTPVLDAKLYEEAVSIAAEQVDVSKLKVTQQQGCVYPQ